MRKAYTVSAPTRIDLSGGTLDLWPLYCLLGGGKTINLAIDVPAKVYWKPVSASGFHLELEGPTGEKRTFTKPLDLKEALVLAERTLRFPSLILSAYVRDHGAPASFAWNVRLETTAPVGSGLGGSSTLAIALARGAAHALGDYVEQGWQWEMMAWARDAESHFLSLPTGTQDYLASLFGGLNLFHSRLGKIERKQFPTTTLETLKESLVLFFSGEEHHSGRSNWEVFKGAFERNAGILKGLKDLEEVTEAVEKILDHSSFSLRELGDFFDEEWSIRKNLFNVTTPRLDEAMEFLKKQGVLGAKVCGAANGGSMLALVDPAQKASLERKATDAGLQVLPCAPSLQGVRVTD